MKRLVITNNKKVEARYSNKYEIKMLENATCHRVLEEGKELATRGGIVLHDPNRNLRSYYQSLVFNVDEEKNSPHEKSLALLEKAIANVKKSGTDVTSDKKPLLSGILQNKDLDVVKKLID